MGDAINIVTKLAQTSITQFFSRVNETDVMRHDISSLISVNSDSNHKRLAQNINNMELKVDMHFVARIGSKIIIPTSQDLDHLWSSCRNFNEVKYALHLYKDDKRKVLFDKPIVWPVTHLVLTMNQMLTGPGI